MNLLDKIAYDTGGYTVQEILSSFCKKILEIIDLVNKNEEVCDESRTILENIRNEVVPHVVEDIMKEMQDSGYFDSLVNVTLIEQLRTELTTLLNNTITDFTTKLDNFDSQLDKKVDIDKLVNINNISSLYLASFFNSNSKTISEFYISKNGVDFEKLDIGGIRGARDGDILYHNGKFYMFLTQTYGEYDTCDFRVFVSENLEKWEEHRINVGLRTSESYQHIWAPDIFVDDDGTVYIIVSKEVESMTDSITGRLELNFRPYLVKATNLDELSFELVGEIVLNNNNKIDGHIEKKDGVYYLFIKKEMNEGEYKGGSIETWKSTDLINWDNVSYTIPTISQYAYEGCYVCKVGDKYFMYLDNYSYDNGGNVHYLTSSDLINWSKAKPINTQFPTRHGCVKKINDIKEYNIIKCKDKIKNNNNTICLSTNGITNKFLELLEIQGNDNYRSCDLKFKITDTQNNFLNGEFVLQIQKKSNTNSIIKFYCVDNYSKFDFTNNLVVVDMLNGTYKVLLKVTTSASTVNLNISSFSGLNFEYKINKNIHEQLPTGTVIKVNDNVINNDNAIKGKLDRVLKYIDLTTIDNDGVIDNLTIEQNTIYTCTSAKEITINNVNIPTYDNFSRIYFCLYTSSTAGKIILKKSSNVLINSDYVIHYSNGNNDAFVEFVIHGGKLRKVS